MIEIIESNKKFIHFHIKNTDQFYNIEVGKEILNEPKILFDFEIRDQLLFEQKIDDNHSVYIRINPRILDSISLNLTLS
ncbi:hypothetical protein [Heyndrickxia sporothermodurans]|uniref:Uncharacterized protein n=1 Tax=Heyndrickxia sporothermodurans TaxID=46224 RepID=A0AB37H3S9_9BACI|nr:hypothetical protein [Heyndrickxia sporothermodurans]MBL5769410.1 hypothetical protein [Heyndrickxia sporothermodurans]MBL5773192.1 hypothetical protein [Heyndrickxia sporothermodurans]MBL5833443.1 hypothetical protein [Heyndrickxia sporothermodurans]MBL5851948.1 hypothetical protein [Heyndrickxia sporothermodurans]MBL5868119.1 hypothetical protein [Heyndrickxia sporothermodurans]